MSCRLRERDFRAFFRVPFVQYGEASPYVSPMRGDLRRMLDGGRNPVFDVADDITYFTVHRNGVPRGRITAHVHEASNRRHGLRRAYFGFFDCADDPEAANRLLDAACVWAARRGCDEIAGSFNLTAMQQLGVVTDGFEHAPFTDQQYNPPHIPALLEAAGFERTFPMSTFLVDLDRLEPDTLLGPKQRALLGRGDIEARPIRRRHIGRSLEQFRRLLNASFDANPMFVPLTGEQFRFQAGELMWVVDERLSTIWCVGGEPRGAVVCIPDLNPLIRATGSRLRFDAPVHWLRYRRRLARASGIFIGVSPESQDMGLAGLMLHSLTATLKRLGYRELGTTWIADANRPSLRQFEKMGGRPLHRLHLYRRSL